MAEVCLGGIGHDRYRSDVWLLILTILGAIVVVVVTRGDPRELSRIRLRGTWLLFVGLGIQIVLEFVEIPKSQIDTIGYALLMAAYAFILAFCFVNLPTPGIKLITVGIALNALVIALNQGMPTEPVGNNAQGRRVQEPIERSVKHRPASSNDLLGFLGDKIVLPEPFDEVISIGDVVVALGVWQLVYAGSRRRRRRGQNRKRA
jgi:hypothetical protein